MPVSGSAVSFNITGFPYGGGDSSSLRDWQMIKKVERNLPAKAELAQRAAEDLGQCTQCGSEEYSQRPFHRERHPGIEPTG
jgi:hypothetical protein